MAKSALLEDAPPDGFEDSPPDGFDESPAVTAQRPKVSVASPVVRPLDPGAKPLSPAMTAYQRSLDSFLSGDRAGAEIHSKEALKIDPNLTEASRMLDRLAFDQKQGTKNMAQETPSLTFPQQNGQTNLSNAAEWLSKNINKAKPPLPGISGNLPKSLGELIQSVQIGSFPGVEKVEKLSSGIKSKATGIIEPKPVPRGGMPANVFGKLIMAPLEAGLGIPPGTLSKIERQVGEQAISENGQRVIQEAISMFPFTPNEFQQWIGADAPSVFAPKVAMALVEKFPVLGKKFNLADIGPVLKEFITTKNVKVPLGKEELKAFYTFGRESLDPWIYEQLTGKSPSEVKAMLKDALAGKPVFLEKRVPRFGSDSVRKTISAEGPIPGETINGTPPSIIGQDVAPIDKTGQPSYPINNEPSGVTPSSPGGIVPGGRDSGPVVQGSSPDSPPDGFIDGSRVSVGQEIKPQEPSQQSGPERVPTVKPSTENVALPPSPTVQDIGQSAQPQSETTPQPPVEPSAPSGKVKNKKIKKQKQLTPIEGLASVIPRRSTFPILTGFNVKNGVASATDMTSYLETKVDLPDGHYKIVGKNVEKSGLDPAQFPISPKIGNKIGTVDRSDLIRNFDRVEKASSDEESRYVLQSVNLKSENGKAYLTSTDGRRLSTSPLDSAKLPDGSYIIPANLGVGKSLKALSGDTLDVSIINSSDGTPEAISFTSPNGRVVSQLIYGKFPNFDQVIPEPTEQIVLSKSVLENALKELKPYTKGDKRNTVIVNRDGDNISLRVINPDNKRDKTISVKGKTIGGNFAKIKAGSIVMPMQMNEHLAKLGIELGPGHLGGFNLGYLKDAVSSVSGNEVYFGRTDDPLKPIVVRGKPLEEKDITGGNSVVKAQNDMNEEFRKERVWKEIAKANEEERPRIVAQLENEDVVWALGRVKMLPEGTGGNLKSLLEKRSNESTVIRGKPLDKNVTIKKAKQRGPGKGVQASTGGSNIESFEQNTGPIYYSQLQRTIEQKMPNSAPVSMVRALIDPTKGNVKAEEVEWSGINEFLDGKEKVSKAELLDFLKSNEVKIQEVVRSDDVKKDDGLIQEPTKFAYHQLPGGSNYREVLLTLPADQKLPEGWTVRNDLEYGWIVESKGGEVIQGFTKDEAIANARQRLLNNRQGMGDVFKSPHFDEPNILAHVRMNDRTTTDGKHVVFLEEVQSDWHQKGRESGYEETKNYQVSGNNQVWKTFGSKVEAETYLKQVKHEHPSGKFEITEFTKQGTVPNAPFKKTWHELVLKRMLRYAVDNGYDGIAWTTGEQQAERYDLSKHIDWIGYEKRGDLYNIRVFDKGGAEVYSNQSATAKEVEATIGKEMLKKMDAGEGRKSKSIRYLEGLDLKVGGEGMKGFYDQIIPSFLNKYTKKWGGRVRETDLQSGGQWTEGKDGKPKLLNKVHVLDITPSMRSSVSQGQPLFAKGTAKDSSKIESFEQLTPKEQEQTFKMAEEVRGLVSKYAVRVGEKYVPRRAEGAYYPETQNIRLKSLNDLSVAVHEITHSIDDAKAGTSKKIIAAKDRETIAGLTEIYATYYAPGKSDHTVRKRIVEGLATLIQKTAETPTIMREKYGPLLDKFIKPGGRYYDKNYTDLLTDSHGIVGKFQELDKLGQVGAFVTSKFQQKEARSSFLSVWDKIRTEVSDSIWPVEKAAKKAGIERTASDPSLWMRANQAIVGNIENNMVGSKGFWIPTKEGGFRQVSEKNFSDLLVLIGDDHLEDRFGWWLIARDSYFEWKRLDKIAAEIEGLKEKIQLLPETMTPELIAEKKGLIRLLSDKQVEHEEFLQRLNREPLGRDTFERAYIENRDTFQKWGDLFDTFTAANLDLVEMSDLATPEQLDVLRQKEGYAPKKRDIYDDIIGSEKQQLPTVQVGKTKLSSMMARKGSSLSYVNPLYSVVKDHAEIMRKSMKQMVYNKMLNIAPEWPEIFQPVELKVVVDKTTGKMSFPQEKDQNIIMSRGPGGTRHPLLVGRDMKKVIDDVLSFHDLHIAERVLRKAARMFSQGTTGLYPQFVLTNIVMDLPTAMANTRTKMIPVFDALKDLNKALLQNNTPEAKYAREWFASHGERQSLAGWQNEDPDDFFRLLQNEKHWIMRATKSAAGVVDFLSIPAKYSEIMSRLTEYVRSRKAGKPWIVAMEDSARVTTPFVHMGRWGGGTWMKTLVKSISFFNPGIQALDQFVRSAGQKDTQKRLLFVMAATAVASVAGMAWIMKHATQEQKDQYKDLEGKSLTNYAWFPASDGKNLIKIRVDQQYGWLAALVNLAIGETVFGMDYKFRDYADAATSLVPDQFDISHPVMALLNWIPQIVKPSLEVAFDQRTFPTVRPLTPRGLEHVAPGLRSTETTSPVAKELGKRLDLSPIAIDHLIEGYLGRTARFGTGRFSSMKMNPFFQDWYFTSGRNLQDFYDTRERWQYINKEFKTNPKEVSAEDKKSYFHNGPIIKKIEARLDVIREYQKTGKPLKGEELYRNRHAILEDIAKLK